MCWIHLLAQFHLRIKKSTLPDSGNGLFALARKPQVANSIVFKKNQLIIPYVGEVVTHQDLHVRYGEYTAPYALAEGASVVDAACVRGVGSLANHRPLRYANAKYTRSPITGAFRVVATKNIRDGQEIFVNYGRDYSLNDGATHSTRRTHH